MRLFPVLPQIPWIPQRSSIDGLVEFVAVDSSSESDLPSVEPCCLPGQVVNSGSNASLDNALTLVGLPQSCPNGTLSRLALVGAFETGALDTGAELTGAFETGALDNGAELTGAFETGALLTGADVLGLASATFSGCWWTGFSRDLNVIASYCPN
jgi:hypothetical protein